MKEGNFYFRQVEPIQSCMLAMRDLILGFSETIEETVKYGSPCFLYLGKPLVYLWIDKKTKAPYFLFVEGRYINHPRLEQGDRKRMKIYAVTPETDINKDEVEEILGLAMEVQLSLNKKKKK
ncbi:DUF1801 domain-containing protein [Crocinitomix algicola]|uniref:DUF1801 domain-containing protein n=1 Tax=Crocinitomix algicola TaxID=1740263 RepID=UPI000872E774|nr:DUF1801 domain-containing protein [Crocinitomix algicola]